MACLDDNAIADLVDGPPSAPDRRAMLRHLEACPPCRRTAARAIRLLAPGEAATAAPTEFTVGRYVVLDWIGEGAMGVVYRAHDPRIDRAVALKVVASALCDPAERGRALREARAMGRVNHPNVLTVFDAGELDDAVFVATELVEGADLRAFLEAHDPDVEAVLALFRQAALGLAAAHRAGVVHLDVKPENLLVDAGGRVRVADFGLAAAIGAPSGGAGTRGYMAPEQRSHGTVDARADQYALCCALVEALWGARPDAGGDVVLAASCRRGAVPAAVRRALRRGLAHAPSDRFADMDALVDALTSRPRRRGRWALAGAAVVLAVGVLVTKARDAGPAPEVAAVAREVPDPDPALAHARALRLAGRHDEARLEAERVAAEARDDGALARLAEAELLRAKELGATAQHHEAIEILLGAVRAADAAGRPDLQAEALLVSAALEAQDPAAVPRATLLLDQARTLIAQNDLQGRLGFAADHVAGTIETHAGRFEQAADAFARALDGATRALPPDHPFLDQYRWSLALALGTLGRHDAAAALYVRARGEVERALGSGSPRFAAHLAALGALEFNTGEFAAARADLETALAILRAQLGDGAQTTLDVRADLARCLERLGQIDPARDHLNDAVEHTLAAGAPASIAEAYADLGDLELRNGELAAAGDAYEAALTWARRGAPGSPTEARMLTRVAIVRLDRGADAGVRELLEAALSIHEVDGESIIDLVETEFALARATWSDRSDPARAIALAEQARDRLRSNGVVEIGHRDEIEAWLGEHLGGQ